MRLAWTILIVCAAGRALAQQPAQPRAQARPGLMLTTTAFEDGGVIPNRYTQSDANPVSPKLDWTNVPDGVLSFALIMHDLDTAPQKNAMDYMHWMVLNIPASATGLPEAVPATAALPDGTVQARVSRNRVGYMAPGAPVGPYHHYALELFALDIKLELGSDATRADVLKVMEGHVVAKAALIGRYHK
jgi:Raf kinase inhibitor-like YbhB/YbcL family protein